MRSVSFDQPGPAKPVTEPRRVSVIITTHNRARLLPLTLESVLSQTYPNLEVIVVDDGSTDATESLLQQYGDRLIYIRQPNQGVAAARNAGLRRAAGDYLTILDDDDLIARNKLKRQVDYLNQHPGVAAVHCRFAYIDEAGRPLGQAGLLPSRATLADLVRGCYIFQGAPLVRREVYERVGDYDPAVAWASDWDMWLRIVQAGYLFGSMQELLGAYRIMPQTMTSNLQRLEAASMAVLDKVFAAPGLPAQALEAKPAAYANLFFWLGCHHARDGYWDETQRCLRQALNFRPELRTTPRLFFLQLFEEACHPRIPDLAGFAQGMLAHLPEPALAAAPERTLFSSRIQLQLAMAAYAAEDWAAAQAAVRQAFSAVPAAAVQQELFADAVFRYVSLKPIAAPSAFLEQVWAQLPEDYRHLRRARPVVTSLVDLNHAFESRSNGHRSTAFRLAARAVWHQPGLAANRGVLSVLVKSLVGR